LHAARGAERQSPIATKELFMLIEEGTPESPEDPLPILFPDPKRHALVQLRALWASFAAISSSGSKAPL
jgi:hypothetical protein